MGSFIGIENQYIQLVKVLYCKLLTYGKPLQNFPHRVWGLNRRTQRLEASVTLRVLQEYPMQRGKISIFATFGGHIGFLRKKCEYLENYKRYSDFERSFDPKSSTRLSYAKGENFNFRHFWRPSWILAENEKV